MVPVAPIGAPDRGVGASFAALEATTLARGARHLRVSKPTVIAAVIAVAALVVGGALVVSRSSVAGALRATRSQLATTNGRLTDARSQVGDLQQQVTDLQAARDAGRSRLEDANAAKLDVRRSLDACQRLFRIGSSFSTNPPPPHVQARAASLLLSCFEGNLPPSLFP